MVFVIRKQSLTEKGISYGPCFGGEALEEIIRLFKELGFEYWDDFIEFKGDYPVRP